MANAIQATATATANVSVADKSLTAKAASTRRVESRSDWAVIYNHTLDLVVLSLKGEDLGKDPRKGYAFKAVADAPHARGYAQSLLAGFTSKKANKVFAQHEVLKSEETRRKIALAILTATKLGKGDEAHAKAILSKAEPKQAKTFGIDVLAKLNDAPKASAKAEKTNTKLSQPKAESKPKGKGTRKAKSAK